MPRKKTDKPPKTIPENKTGYGLEELSEEDVKKLASNFPDIPNNFPLYTRLEEIHDEYQMRSSHYSSRLDQNEIQSSLQSIATHSIWLSETLKNISKVNNKTIRNLLFYNGFLVRQTNSGKFPDREKLGTLVALLEELAGASKQAHKNNKGFRNTKNHARDYVLVELKKLWEMATKEKAVISVTVGRRADEITSGEMKSSFGKFIKEVMTLLGLEIHSDTALMQTYREVT